MDFQVEPTLPAREAFEAIEARREQIGLPVARLCRTADVDISTYWKLKREDARMPNFRTVKKLKAALAQLEGAA